MSRCKYVAADDRDNASSRVGCFAQGELQLRNGGGQRILSKALKEAKRSEDRAARWNRGRAMLETLCHDHSNVKLTAKLEASVS
jgi:hypothetical protein